MLLVTVPVVLFFGLCSFSYKISSPSLLRQPSLLSAVGEAESDPSLSMTFNAADAIDSLFKREPLEFEGNEGTGELLRSMRREGRALLSSVRRPYGKDEAWKYTNMKVAIAVLFSTHFEE